MKGAFETGVYRNVFLENGYTQEEIDRKIESSFQTMFYGPEEERIYHPVGEDMGYMEDTGNHDARTEGMSYGMMMCVQMDRRKSLTVCGSGRKTYMYMEDGEKRRIFRLVLSAGRNKDSYGPAPDGEEYFAMALFFASRRWGDGEGIFNYSREARAILRECIHQGEDGKGGELCGKQKTI